MTPVKPFNYIDRTIAAVSSQRGDEQVTISFDVRLLLPQSLFRKCRRVESAVAAVLLLRRIKQSANSIGVDRIFCFRKLKVAWTVAVGVFEKSAFNV